MNISSFINSIIDMRNNKDSLFYWRTSHITIQKRINFLILLFSILFFSLCVRLLNLSVLSKEYLRSNTQTLTKRLNITDRNGNLLAVNLSSASLYANPKKVLYPEHEAQKLIKIIPSLNKKEVLNKLRSKKTFVWIKRDITPLEQQKLYNLGLVGFGFEREQKRFYTYGPLLSHVVGYVGRDLCGLAGIEKFYDKFLTSQPEVEDRSDFGNKLQLSIDVRMQNILSDELDKTIKKFSAKGGSGIILDPNNGEILALVSKPDFDPHYPGKAKPKQLFNMATQGVYEVGSSMKGLTVAIGIDSGKTAITDAYNLSYMKVKGFQLKDTYKLEGWHSLPYMFIKSTNIGMAQIMLEIGKKDLMDYLRRLRLLSPLKIELPERARPLFPDYSRLTDLSLTTISYGYGISESPAHFAQAMIPMVNGGILYPITLIKRNKLVKGTRVFKESTSNDLKKIMRLVVSTGTGKKAGVDGYYIGGKTGTANIAVNGKYDKSKRISSFVGIMPASKPQYLVYVVLNEPVGIKETFGFAGGGWSAAPTVGAIFKRMISLLGLPKMDPNSQEIKELNDIEYKIYNET
ncbi:MAG: hypothetical protein DGJ47_000580 [Rickettsiaceae bacterium]